MTLVRKFARPLLAAPYVLDGVRNVRRPSELVDSAPSLFGKVDGFLKSRDLPVTSYNIVQISGALAAGGGLMLAAGRAPRLAALLMAKSTTVSLVARTPFWKLSGQERDAEIKSLLKDLGLVGALLIASVDTDGRPSLAYRAQKTIEDSKNEAEKKAKATKRKADVASTKSDLDKRRKDVAKNLSKKRDEIVDATKHPELEKRKAAAKKQLDAAAKEARKHADEARAKGGDLKKQAQKRGADLKKQAEKAAK